jgi:hypothetical protein
VVSRELQPGCFSLALLLILPLCTWAQGVDSGKRATVAELEHLLSKFGHRTDIPAAASTEARPDLSVKSRDDQMQALEIDFIQLTERLTPWTRESLEKIYRLGPQGFDALERVADLSRSCLPLPPISHPILRPTLRSKSEFLHSLSRLASAVLQSSLPIW